MVRCQGGAIACSLQSSEAVLHGLVILIRKQTVWVWTGLDWIRIHDWIEMVRIGSVGIVSYQGLEREDQSVQLDSASEKGTRGISKLAKS